MTTPNKLLVKQYALCVYQIGTRKLTTVHVDYVEAVKEFAALNYAYELIDAALVKGYITEQEYQETIAYKSQTQSAD